MSLTDLSLSEAALALRERRTSALELVDASLAQAERVSPSLNAFLRIDSDAARAQARAAVAACDAPGVCAGGTAADAAPRDAAGLRPGAGRAGGYQSFHHGSCGGLKPRVRNSLFG